MKRVAHFVFAAAALLIAPRTFAADPAAGPRVVVPAHDIERGETITDADVMMATVEPQRMRPGLALAANVLVGHEARRLLRAGEPVRLDDVRMPILVSKGATVTMTFNVPGITLTATGRAITEGGLGETIVVQNPVSFRQVSCIVTGPGEVRAGDATLVASNP